MANTPTRRAILLITIMAAAVLVAFTGIALAQSPQPDTSQAQTALAPLGKTKESVRIPGRYIVVLKDDVSDPKQVANEKAQNDDLKVDHTYNRVLKGFSAEMSGSELDELRKDPRVKFVSEDSEVRAEKKKRGHKRRGGGGGGSYYVPPPPPPPPQVLPTGVERIWANESSTKAGDGGGDPVDANIAILDTGISNHPDLNVAGGYDCTGSGDYLDRNGHGTHVAGIAAAKDDAIGVVGVAPGARLWAVKVLHDNGDGSWSEVICGLDWVTSRNTDNSTTNHLEVANMSLGGAGSDDGDCGNTNKDALHQALCNSVAAGVTYVVAAGNSGADVSAYAPSAYDEVITVSALSDSDGKPGGTGGAPSCRTGEKDDYPATFSNYASSAADEGHTIAAPGVCIRSTWLSGQYNTISGTSMASPHVAGLAALCIASKQCDSNNDGKVEPSEVMAKLLSDADTYSNDTTVSPYYGFTGDPKSQNGSHYYSYLAYAGGY